MIRKILLFVMLSVGMGGPLSGEGGEPVDHEVHYLLERAGSRTKRGRLLIPEGQAATVILNGNSLLRFRASQREDGKIRIETEIWDLSQGRKRERVARPALDLLPGQTGEFHSELLGLGSVSLEVRVQNQAAGHQKSAPYERVSTSLFAPRRQSWDE